MRLYYSGDGEGAGNSVVENLHKCFVMLSAIYHKPGVDYSQDTKRIGRMANNPSVARGHFLDSGAFTLWTKARKYAEENGCGRWDYYDTDEFWQYVDDYAAFVKKYSKAIDLYANVDVIPNAELTWRNQRYLEDKHGLSPVPVVHYTTGLKWLRRYWKLGYELIGLGGLVGTAGQESCKHWIDQAFDLVGDAEGKPRVKLHAFGVTSYPLLIRYPWWSVDSVTWARQAGYGNIYVPHKRKGSFDFGIVPYSITMSMESKRRKRAGYHFTTLKKAEQNVVLEWLELIGVPLGKLDANGEIVEYGVMTRHTERRLANILFFEKLCEWLPEWPWPFRGVQRTGFGFI